MKNWFMLFGTALSISLMGCSKAEETGIRINPQDARFIFVASQSNNAEIVLGQLAADSSQTPAIKAFGQQMVADHNGTQASLQTLAGQLGTAAPTGLDAAHEQIRSRLLTLKGNSFDSLYIHTQVIDHLEAINLYQNTHGFGNNVAIKNYVDGIVPHLQQHWLQAEALAAGY